MANLARRKAAHEAQQSPCRNPTPSQAIALRGRPSGWTRACPQRQNGVLRPRGSRPDALQSVTVLEALKGLAAQHGGAGVPLKDLEAATRSHLNYRALTDAINALV